MKNSHLIQRAAALALAAVMAVMTAGCGAKEQKEGAKGQYKTSRDCGPGNRGRRKGALRGAGGCISV